MRQLPSLLRVAVFAIALVGLAGAAAAHGLTPGSIGIYFAVEHILTEMPAPLALIAFGLLLGLNPQIALTWGWWPFLAGTALGLVGTLAWRLYIHPVMPLLLLTVAMSLWVTTYVRVTRYPAAILGMCTGYFIGVFAAPGPASWSMQANAISGGLLGISIAVLGTYALVNSIAEKWTYDWISVAFRVVASWLAAIAAMTAALSFR